MYFLRDRVEMPLTPEDCAGWATLSDFTFIGCNWKLVYRKPCALSQANSFIYPFFEHAEKKKVAPLRICED